MSGYDTTMVCRIIQVSRSGYYSHKTTDENELSEQEKQVINCFEKNAGIMAGYEYAKSF